MNVVDANVSAPFCRERLEYFEYRETPGSGVTLGMSYGTTDVWIGQAPADRAAAGYVP